MYPSNFLPKHHELMLDKSMYDEEVMLNQYLDLI